MQFYRAHKYICSLGAPIIFSSIVSFQIYPIILEQCRICAKKTKYTYNKVAKSISKWPNRPFKEILAHISDKSGLCILCTALQSVR